MLHESQNIVITKLPTELLKQMLIMEIPNNPTNHVAAQQYRMKSSIEEYEVNGLNALLMQMFKNASMFGAVPEETIY